MIRSTKELSREFLEEFLDEFEYEPEAKESLLAAFDKLYASEIAAEVNKMLLDYRDESFDFKTVNDEALALFRSAGIEEYGAIFILVAHLSSTMRELYKKRGIDDEIWFETMKDLKYKAKECILVKKVWGTFVSQWYNRFFNLKIFSFGRLQFEQRPFYQVAEVNGIKLTETTPILSVHIPRTGTPLDRKSFEESYEKGVKFFKDSYFGGGPVLFICSSWLLWPRHKEFLKPTSNILDFASDFHIVCENLLDDYAGCWRVFETPVDLDNLDALPENSSLQRAYKALIKKGEKVGYGLGVYIVD